MRNLKKHLSVLLVVAMIFTMMAPVFAASPATYEDEAVALYGLGLFKGVSEDSYNPDLGSALTREQATIMLLRLFGHEKDAQAMTQSEIRAALAKFEDANLISDWARNQVAYATDNGIINGIPTENGLIFEPQGNLKGIQFASMVLKALGVNDFSYEGALERLAAVKAINVPQMIAFDKEQLIRDDVVGISYGTLTATTANGKTVIENLINDGKVERAYAEKLGLVEPIEEPVVTEKPTEEPVVTEKPTEEPVVTEKPTEEPVVTEKPTEEPVVTEKPTEEPVEAIATVEYIPTEARSIAQGQSLTDVATVKITAGKEDVNVTGLKLQRSGLSADNAVESLTIWNGTEKLNSIGRFSNGIANIAFRKVVTVKAGEAVELAVKMNVNKNAEQGQQLVISLTEIKADKDLVGTFPMAGNMFTIAPADLGKLNIELAGDAPSASVNAGDKDVRLAKFKLEFRGEAQILKQLTLTQEGSVTESDVVNYKLVDEDGKVMAEGVVNNDKIDFTFEKEYESGSTALLTVKGDVVGGATRNIKLSVDNVNDVQSVGKTYGTTIVAASIEDAEGNPLEIERGTLVLSRASSSPAATTIAENVDDQKVASITVEAIGEEIQLEDIKINAVATGTDALKKVTEVKVMKGNTIVASQDFNEDMGAETELSFTDLVTVNPGSPIVLDITLDIKDATRGATYELGVSSVKGTGLTSAKDAKAETGSMGNKMTVGEIKVTVEQVAEVDGYVFTNQSKEKIAEFEVSHNLGETVRLSSIALEIKGATGNVKAVKDTFKNIVFVNGNNEVSKKITTIKDNTITNGVMNVALNDGINVKAGEVLKLGLVTDITSTANKTDKFEVYVKGMTAMTLSNTTVNVDKSTYSRVIEISSPAKVEDITAEYSYDGDLENRNVLREDKNVALAQWTFKNNSSEDVKIDKLWLTANYGQVTPEKDVLKKDADGNCLFKDNEEIKLVVLTDMKDATKFDTSKTDVKYINEAGHELALVSPAPTEADKDKIKVVENATDIRATEKQAVAPDLKPAYVSNYVLKDGDGKTLATVSSLPVGAYKEVTLSTPMVIEAMADGVAGENDLVITANIHKNAQFGGQISIALGGVDQVIGEDGRPVETEGPAKMCEFTGAISGERDTVTINKVLEAGEDEEALVNTVAISKVEAEVADFSKSPEADRPEQVVGAFKLVNKGDTTVKLTTVKLELLTNTTGDTNPLDKLALVDKDGRKVAEASITAAIGDENDTVTFALTDAKSIKKNSSEEFKVKLLGESSKLNQGETIQLAVDKEGTIYDDVNGTGYTISIDKEVTLPEVTAVSKN